MRPLPRRITASLLTAFTLLALGSSGCSEIGEAIDCHQMCEQIQVCIDSDIDVDRCADRCEDKADNDVLRNQLDQCTDCLDRDYACAEVPDHCEACQTVTEALL
jgi:hypothetical protein